jgi:hypothetical protein
MTTEFYDSAGGHFPAGATHVALYADGDFPFNVARSAEFRYVRWITVLGGTDAARYAGALDWEKGNQAFTGNELHDWAAGRKAMNCLARIYVDLANLEQAHKDVDGLDNVRWWIASWGEKRTAAELAAASGGLIKAETIWGQQFQGDTTGGYDTSVLLSDW